MYCETYVGVTVVDQLGGVGAAGAAAAGAAAAGAPGAAGAGIAGAGVAGAVWAWADIVRAMRAERQMAMTVLFMLCLMGSGFSRG